MKAPVFSYVKPASLDEAFDVLERYGDDARLLAGGQSLVAALNMRLAAPRVLIDINGIRELSGIRVAGETVMIGALARHHEIETSPEIAHRLPLLHLAMPHVAHTAVRSRGTFGGSIAFADPAAELPACSLALDASFLIAGRRARRTVAAREFFTGLYETALAPGEILLGGEFPVARPGYRSAFQELSRRHGDYAIVGVAAHARVEDRVLSDVRLAFFGVGATPVLARTAASLLEGRIFGLQTTATAQAALDADLAPHEDTSSGARVRMHLARVLTGRALARLADGKA